MKLTGEIAYNGWSNSLTAAPAGGGSADGFLLHEADISPIEVSQYLDKRAVHDGLDAGDVYLGGRRIHIVGSVLGSSEGSLWDNLGAFEAAFSPVLAYNADPAAKGFLPFDYFRPTANIAQWPTSTYPSGIPLRLYARPFAPPRWRVTRADEGGVPAKGGAIRVVADLLAADPRQYLQTTVSANVTTATQTALYRGNYPTYPIVTVAMSAAGSTSATNIVLGSTTLTLVLSNAFSTGTYTIDYANQLVLDNGGSLKASILSTVGPVQWGQVTRGTTFSRSGATTGIASVTIAYREAFA